MNYDEFAFANQQLAGMLRQGIPLEGALRQLCRDMQRGPCRKAFEQWEKDLAKGLPMKEALAANALPEFYRQMVRVGVQSQDLPGLLTLLADYYQRLANLGTRLKGLMVYPLIVLGAATALSLLFTFFGFQILSTPDVESLINPLALTRARQAILAQLLVPPSLLLLALLAVAVICFTPAFRRALRWRLPAFREAALSQFAAAMGTLLRHGGSLDDALKLMASLEQGTPLGRALAGWRERLAAGRGKFSEFATPSAVFPPLFLWLVSQAGEDLATGFLRASELYQARAAHRADLLLYAALPITTLMLGCFIVGQLWPLVRGIVVFMDMLGSVS